MGRKAVIDFYGYEYEVSVEGAGQGSGILSADAETAGWFPHFPLYEEDSSGRLLYFYQPMCSSVMGLRRDIDWMREHPRPHFTEVFDRVDIREEYPAGKFKTVKTLHGVTLLGALEALVETFKL